MATGFPASTGDVLSAAMFNGLVAFTLNSQTGTTLKLASIDRYQVLVITSNAVTKTVSIPPDATYAFLIGPEFPLLTPGAGN